MLFEYDSVAIISAENLPTEASTSITSISKFKVSAKIFIFSCSANQGVKSVASFLK